MEDVDLVAMGVKEIVKVPVVVLALVPVQVDVRMVVILTVQTALDVPEVVQEDVKINVIQVVGLLVQVVHVQVSA